MYGSLVIRLTKDIEDPHEINKQLELIGYNIGQRIIDDIIDIGEPIKDIVPDMLNILFKRFLAINPFNLQSKSEVCPCTPNTLLQNPAFHFYMVRTNLPRNSR